MNGHKMISYTKDTNNLPLTSFSVGFQPCIKPYEGSTSQNQ
jgi:hypothetical protein